jgi:hypothetical protein
MVMMIDDEDDSRGAGIADVRVIVCKVKACKAYIIDQKRCSTQG